MSVSNFEFLKEEYPILYSLGVLAEKSCYVDPSNTLGKLRIITEKITQYILEYEDIEDFEHKSHNDRLKLLQYEVRDIDREIIDAFHDIRKSGNKAAHQGKGTVAEARFMLRKAFHISVWFYELYTADVNVSFDYPQQQEEEPEDDARVKELEKALEDAKKELSLKNSKLVELQKRSEEEIEARRKEVATRYKNKTEETEAETRQRIDQQLREAGWDCDTETLNFKKHKTLPAKGQNRAIAEWKCGKLWADYALFIGNELVGIVEAKKHIKNVRGDLAQAKNYSVVVESGNESEFVFHPNHQKYKVPFVFATNGRKYLKQHEVASGIWFWDARENTNIERALTGWFSPDELKEKLKYDDNVGKDVLRKTDYDILSDPQGLSLRDYQIEAIKSLDKHIVENKEERRALLAMATGTGKTRTMIGMCYRLIKSKAFRRILFLVDRRMLGDQAADAFQDVKVEGLQTFAQIYDIKNLEDASADLDTKIHFATVQSLVKRIAYSDNPPNIGEYDCIVVDEAHRGYTLDKDMDDEELFLSDQKEYQSKYRMVLDHFDAYRIGLTATPAVHTAEIFGEPIFNYSYRRAVVEGHLIDFEPPYVFQTQLSENGIVWEKGDTVKIYDPEENDIVEGGVVEDEIKVEVKGFNKRVITDSFNRTILKELIENTEYGVDIEGKKKTLIFAATDAHADMIVNILKEEYDEMGASVDHEAIVKITGNVATRTDLLRKFKNEHNPNIVVTVDLLTTGIDVPAICNLVFLRRVNSRILYDQMLGRATRKCPDIGKDVFKIVDCVGVTEVMAKEEVMKPIAPSVTKTFVDLSEELKLIEDEARQQVKLDRIIAKLQRKLRSFSNNQMEHFESHTQETSASSYALKLKAMDFDELQQEIADKQPLWEYLDKQKSNYNMSTLYSDHPDELNDVSRAYGKELQPKDYIDLFVEFIQTKRNEIQALNIVCTKPGDLTREDLKQLRLILDEAGFPKSKLNTAFQQTTNQAIVADVISMIRTAALGTDLKPHEQRIQDAVSKMKTENQFNSVQLKWLDRIEKQLLQESVITLKDFDKPPFSNDGGLKRTEKIFKGETSKVLEELNDYLYA